MQKTLFLLTTLLLTNCKKDNHEDLGLFRQDFIELGTHRIAAYSIETDSRYLVVFESGLGDDHSVWTKKKVAETISENCAVVIYDRGGYGKSTINNSVRNVEQLTSELEAVVDQYAAGRKVILVGHSLGGLVIRDYAIKNPGRTAGLLFADPSHEAYNQPTQAIEDLIYNAFSSSYGAGSGPAKEARELVENFSYISRQPGLPDIPVVVLTSMKQDDANNTSDLTYHKSRQDWYNAHESLKNGVTDFTHIQTTASGHYIITEEPDLVTGQFNLLLSRLP